MDSWKQQSLPKAHKIEVLEGDILVIVPPDPLAVGPVAAVTLGIVGEFPVD
jgi:hypothetical protein